MNLQTLEGELRITEIVRGQSIAVTRADELFEFVEERLGDDDSASDGVELGVVQRHSKSQTGWSSAVGHGLSHGKVGDAFYLV